jgi:hypothetical protein
MNWEGAKSRSGAFAEDRSVRNPFGVMDVPSPDDEEVTAFAGRTVIDGSADDDNAVAWSALAMCNPYGGIEGTWSSRWNGGVDGTIPGDDRTRWKQGRADVKTAGGRVYLLFDWAGGSRRGLIDARQEDADRLVGKYINLTDPAITRPWVGLIVSHRRIDGRWPGGRLDFRR